MKNTVNVSARGYKIYDVAIYELDCIANYFDTFKSIYVKLLEQTSMVAFLNNSDKKYYNLIDIYDITIEIIEKVAKQHHEELEQLKSLENTILPMLYDDFLESSYLINEEYFNNSKHFKLVDNSITGILITALI